MPLVYPNQNTSICIKRGRWSDGYFPPVLLFTTVKYFAHILSVEAKTRSTVYALSIKSYANVYPTLPKVSAMSCANLVHKRAQKCKAIVANLICAAAPCIVIRQMGADKEELFRSHCRHLFFSKRYCTSPFTTDSCSILLSFHLTVNQTSRTA